MMPTLLDSELSPSAVPFACTDTVVETVVEPKTEGVNVMRPPTLAVEAGAVAALIRKGGGEEGLVGLVFYACVCV